MEEINENEVGIMRKTILFTAILICCLCLSGCGARNQSARTDSPEAAVNSAMKALKGLDLDTFNDCTDNYVSTQRSWLGFAEMKEYRVFGEILQPGLIKGKKYDANYAFAKEVTEKIRWKIKDVRTDGDESRVELSITNTDMTDVTGYYMIHVMEDAINSDGTGLGEFVEDMMDLEDKREGFLPYMKDQEDSITKDVSVRVEKKNGKWILHVSDSFVNAFMGNLNSEKYSKEVEERLDQLEDDYEDKMENWGDAFGDKVERSLESIFGV